MKRKGLATLFAIICLMLILAALPFMAACAQPAPSPAPTPTPAPTPAPLPPSEPIVLKAVTAFPRITNITQAFLMYQRNVNELAKGELVIQYIGGPEVMSIFDMASAARRGVIDLAFVFTGAYSGLVPAAKVLRNSKLSYEEERKRGLYNLFQQEYKKAGLYFLGRGWGTAPTWKIFNLWVQKKIERPQDLAGMKIGATSTASNPQLKALGAFPTVLAIPDMYPALDRGVIDGYTAGRGLIITLGLHEITNYMIDQDFYTDDITFIMGLDMWKGLSQKWQDLLTDAYLKTEQEWLPLWGSFYEEDRQIMQNAGVEFIKFSPEDAQWFDNLAHQALWDEMLIKHPDIMPKFYELMVD